ncbi:MAG: ABC-F type ribosomal protection protein [Clostridiales bacterium]|nr:ABC-F type ribosomal protection protein [Clostridiales bacterium]
MARIQVSHLTFAYDGSPDLIFDDISFQIDTDWKLGFIGRNGRGKTTLLRILTGELPDQGAVSAPIAFDYFPYSIPNPHQTPLEMAADMDEDGQIWRFLKEIADLDIADEILSQPFSTLSGGEQAKVLLAMLFSREHHFLLIDEPTNHLDMAGRETVSRYLNSKKGFILVSHDRAFLDGCVDHILSLNRANIEVQKGNFSSWEENKRRQDQFEMAENARLKKEITSLQSAARQARSWADKVESTKIGMLPGQEKNMDHRAYVGEKSRRMQQRRKNLEARMEKSIDEKQGLLKNIEKAEELKLFPLPHPAHQIIDCKDISIAYENRKILDHLSFSLKSGDILALTGRNGCGKSSIFRMLTGEIFPASGEMRLASNLIISSVPQQAHLQGTLRNFIQESRIDETLFKTILRKLDFSREQFEKDMQSYSAGQKKKVLIARSLCQQAHLYLWDEPLNYIDVLSRMQIERLIAQFRPTMILIEHDRTFVEQLATKIIVLKQQDPYNNARKSMDEKGNMAYNNR